MPEKHKLHNVRLDDEVWAAIKSLNCSLNQYLRASLLSQVASFTPLKPELGIHLDGQATRGIRPKGDLKR